MTVSAEFKNKVVNNIEAANSKYYQAQVMTNKINTIIFNDILDGLTEDEIISLYNLGEKKINEIKVEINLLDVIKSFFGK